MPYVFYDTETTGTETAFDQILQFAAIKTDDDFNELDRINVRCRLLPHIIPAPGALRARADFYWISLCLGETASQRMGVLRYGLWRRLRFYSVSRNWM